MGRTECGFNFLGYRFKPDGVTLAEKTVANFLTKALRLYEQEPLHFRIRWLGEYIGRWKRWAKSGGISIPTLKIETATELLESILNLATAYG